MAKEKFGFAIDEKIVREVDELVADTIGYNYVEISGTPGCRNPSRDYSQQYECDDLRVNRSEIAETILTAFVHSESNHAEREIIIRKRKDTL